MAVVLVTDGETRAALAAVRSLARAGHTVHVAAARLPCLAGASRYASRRLRVPSPRESPAEFVAELERHVEQGGVGVVLPVTDAATSAVLELRGGEVGGAIVAAAQREAYDLLSDKAALVARASAAGIAVPRSIVVSEAAGLEPAAQAVGFPCVLKPHRSVVRVGRIGTPGAPLGGAVRTIRARAELEIPYAAAAFPIVVQQWVPGRGEGVFLLMDRGRRVAAFAHRRIREKPPRGGVSVYREAVPLPADVTEGAERLLAAVGWHGAAMVEFRRTPAHGAVPGTAYLMEVNGRLWGSLQLAIDAGVDFPNLIVRLALGETVPAVNGYRTGVRSRWFWGDVDHLLLRLLRSRRRLGLGPDAPSRLRVLRDFFRFGREGDREEVFRRDDPRPFLRETVDWIRGRGS